MTCGPIHGIRVADMTQMLAGPVATQMLGDMGAEVIKIEPPGGERTRGANRDKEDKPRWLFLGRNRNKRSIVANLKNKDGLEVMYRLIRWADVFVHNFRPGAVDRLKLSYEQVKAVNESLIYASVSGYGDKGDLRDLPGQDMQLQAFGGLASINGYEDDPRPSPPAGAAVVDSATAALITCGILAALYEREKTGLGQEVKTSLLGGALLLQENSFGPYLASGELPRKARNGHPMTPPPYGIWKAGDGNELAISNAGEETWPTFCSVIRRPELTGDPRFLTTEARLENREQLFDIVQNALAVESRDDWVNLFRQAGFWVSPVSNYAELCATSHLRDNDLIVDTSYPSVGEFTVLNTPISLSNHQTNVRRRPPQLGEHTRDILNELSYTEDEIESLYSSGAVA